jgi:hypothetical protein
MEVEKWNPLRRKSGKTKRKTIMVVVNLYTSQKMVHILNLNFRKQKRQVFQQLKTCYRYPWKSQLASQDVCEMSAIQYRQVRQVSSQNWEKVELSLSRR